LDGNLPVLIYQRFHFDFRDRAISDLDAVNAAGMEAFPLTGKDLN